MTAGVREYWMVDVEKKKVLIYDFEHENYPILFGFDTEVPVGIFEGQCKVDFGEDLRISPVIFVGGLR